MVIPLDSVNPFQFETILLETIFVVLAIASDAKGYLEKSCEQLDITKKAVNRLDSFHFATLFKRFLCLSQTCNLPKKAPFSFSLYVLSFPVSLDATTACCGFLAWYQFPLEYLLRTHELCFSSKTNTNGYLQQRGFKHISFEISLIFIFPNSLHAFS